MDDEMRWVGPGCEIRLIFLPCLLLITGLMANNGSSKVPLKWA